LIVDALADLEKKIKGRKDKKMIFKTLNGVIVIQAKRDSLGIRGVSFDEEVFCGVRKIIKVVGVKKYDLPKCIQKYVSGFSQILQCLLPKMVIGDGSTAFNQRFKLLCESLNQFYRFIE
jgi:hypothetical protein